MKTIVEITENVELSSFHLPVRRLDTQGLPISSIVIMTIIESSAFAAYARPTYCQYLLLSAYRRSISLAEHNRKMKCPFKLKRLPYFYAGKTHGVTSRAQYCSTVTSIIDRKLTFLCHRKNH